MTTTNQSKIQDFFTPKKDKIEQKYKIEDKIYIYTDGACSKNGSKQAKAGIGIYFAENDPRNVSKRVEGKQTNNTAELSAIIEAYNIILKDKDKEKDKEKNKKDIIIATDSEYAIKCATTYGQKCDKKNWSQDEIPNKELVKTLFYLHKENQLHINLMHIRAHTNKTDIHSLGNANADRLANESLL